MRILLALPAYNEEKDLPHVLEAFRTQVLEAGYQGGAVIVNDGSRDGTSRVLREWAARMPAEFPAYNGGRLTEAAGNDHNGCRMRVVSFTTADAPQRVIDNYRGLVTRAGYSAEQQQRGDDQVLGGTRGESAYYLIVTPQGNGSDVSLIVNNGR